MAGKISSSQDSDDLQSKSGMLLKIMAVMEGLAFIFCVWRGVFVLSLIQYSFYGRNIYVSQKKMVPRGVEGTHL